MSVGLAERLERCYAAAVFDVLRGRGLADTVLPPGIVPLDQWIGRADGFGRDLRVTSIAVADGVAAAADLARAKDSLEPAVIVRGLDRFVTADDGQGAAALRRPPEDDLFR